MSVCMETGLGAQLGVRESICWWPGSLSRASRRLREGARSCKSGVSPGSHSLYFGFPGASLGSLPRAPVFQFTNTQTPWHFVQQHAIYLGDTCLNSSQILWHFICFLGSSTGDGLHHVNFLFSLLLHAESLKCTTRSWHWWIDKRKIILGC